MNFVGKKDFGIKEYCLCIVLISYLSSCAILNVKVKKYQPNKPFVFSHKHTVNGDISKDEKNTITTELENYWADSLKERRVFKPFKLRNIISQPPIFDTFNISKTKRFMDSYLKSRGFYYSNIRFTYDTTFASDKKEQRINLTATIDLGKKIKIDTVAYKLYDTIRNTTNDSILQQLAMQQYKNSLLVKGESYTKQKIADELDRLVTHFRQNGYYKFTREHIYALVDTTNEKLLKLTLDPIELAKLIEEAEKKRKENPEWSIAIKQRPTNDSSILTKFYIRHVYFYPETKVTDIPDSLITQKFKEQNNTKGDLTMRYLKGKFTIRPLREHLFLRKDSLYKENLFYKTVNTLSKLNAWQQVDARVIQSAKDSLDIHYFLVPYNKYQANYNIESSLNYGDFTAGNLLGLSLSSTLLNRNVNKAATQSSTNAKVGVELNLFNRADATRANEALIQTMQFTLSNTWSIPRLLLQKQLRKTPVVKNLLNNAESRRTLISVLGNYTERFDVFRLKSAIGNFGWEWQRSKDFYFWKPLNIELYQIDTLKGLEELFKANPYLKNSFNNGNVVGFGLGAINYQTTRDGKNKFNNHFYKFGFEESGLATLAIPSLKNKIYRFIKLEAEYKFNKKILNKDLAYRFFAGVGIPLSGQSLPFFKQYFAGGPSSMRAWTIKQLGLGSSTLSDTIPSTSFRDRFGDMQLETNLEYRFPLMSISGYKISSAVFADIGNVWNLKKDANNANANFSFSHLYKDLAIGVGTGLRLDFTYTIIRVDIAYKVKDPGRDYNDGWMKNFTWKEKRNNINKTEVKNFALQLGIGFPF